MGVSNNTGVWNCFSIKVKYLRHSWRKIYQQLPTPYYWTIHSLNEDRPDKLFCFIWNTQSLRKLLKRNISAWFKRGIFSTLHQGIKKNLNNIKWGTVLMNWLRQASFPKITAILARLVAKIQNKESEKVRLNFSKKNHFSKNFWDSEKYTKISSRWQKS